MRLVIALLVLAVLAGCGHKFALASDAGTGGDSGSAGSNVCVYGSSHYDDGCQFGP